MLTNFQNFLTSRRRSKFLEKQSLHSVFFLAWPLWISFCQCTNFHQMMLTLLITVQIFLLRERLQSILISASVCVSVRQDISRTPWAIFTKFLCMLPMAVGHWRQATLPITEKGWQPHWRCIVLCSQQVRSCRCRTDHSSPPGGNGTLRTKCNLQLPC